MVFDIIIG